MKSNEFSLCPVSIFGWAYNFIYLFIFFKMTLGQDDITLRHHNVHWAKDLFDDLLYQQSSQQKTVRDNFM